MVLVAEKQLEKAVSISDAENISVLGLDQNRFLLFTGTSPSRSRSSTARRTFIGGLQLTDGEQNVFYRHSACVKITHAALNTNQSLCCFVTRSESNNYDVFVAEIGAATKGHLLAVKCSRSSPLQAYLTAHNVMLIFCRQDITVFRLPRNGYSLDEVESLNIDAGLNDCIYYQWDTVPQRLHVIKKRPAARTATATATGYETLCYTAYTISATGQFDSIITVDFDLPLTASSPSQSKFEILSSDASLFLCWQSGVKEETEQVEYIIVSLGHGRTMHITKPLNRNNWDIFQSRKVHFGLLDGDYVFAFLRGEFIHLLNFNVHSNFYNHLFLPDNGGNLPYDTKYTTQRGIGNKTLTLAYEKKNLFTYTIKINADELVRGISPTTIHSIAAYAIVALKDNHMLAQVLEKIFVDLKDDISTKMYLKEILTALIFTRLSKKIHQNKYLLVFPSTTENSHHTNDTQVSLRSTMHHRVYEPERGNMAHTDSDHFDKLRLSFDLARKHRHKLPHSHPIMSTADEDEFDTEARMEANPVHRSSVIAIPPSPSPSPSSERRSLPLGLFTFGRRRESAPTVSDVHPRSYLLLDPRNKNLFNSVVHDLQQLHSSWEQGRIKELAFEYVQITQLQCDYLIKLLTRFARFDRAQSLMNDESTLTSKNYATLLTLLEKLYLAMVELGFSPTEELQRTLIVVSFLVMPFDRFVAAIDQNILNLTEEFVTRVILELDDDPTSYAMKEQLIYMLPDINADVHSRLFALIKNDRAKRTTAQLIVARRLRADKRSLSSYASGMSNEIPIDEMMNVNTNANGGASNQSRLIEQAAVTFFRDCNQRGILDDDELSLVKVGLLSLASSAP